MANVSVNNRVITSENFIYGCKRGLPIALGYIPVGFTFGLMVVSGGLSPWIAVFTSLSNLTSAGQFAGIRLLFSGASYLEITIATLVINLRYLLMSFSLTQEVDPNLSLGQRLICSFGITDETFSVAAVEKNQLSFSYLIGLMLGPFIAWTTGTALGGCVSTVLPQQVNNAMGIALYAMFIALIIPPAKKSGPVFKVILISVSISIILKYLPVFSFITDGFRIIIATVSASAIAAVLWPVHDMEHKDLKEKNNG